jgi:hypothetical protein
MPAQDHLFVIEWGKELVILQGYYVHESIFWDLDSNCLQVGQAADLIKMASTSTSESSNNSKEVLYRPYLRKEFVKSTVVALVFRQKDYIIFKY